MTHERSKHGQTVAAALLVGLCLSGAPTLAADTPDAWITIKTKIALMTTDNVSAADLNVDTVNGNVTLHGKVPSQAEKSKAEQVVSKLDGVKSVKNLLQIVPASKRAVVARADNEVKDAVQSAFTTDARVSDSGITVASVNKGVVLLAGKTKSLESHLDAVEIANRVRGVRRVASDVQVDAGS